jgi:hypothetical protein
MKANFIFTLLLLSQFVVAQKIDTFNDAMKYIQDYYSSFSTGYDFDGKYVTVTDNYNTVLEDSQFTLTFDAFGKDNNRFKNTISFDLKEIISIEPYGGENVEIIGNETLVIPLNGKLAFKTANETYEIKIYYEIDEDVERTKIYKTFKTLIETHKN